MTDLRSVIRKLPASVSTAADAAVQLSEALYKIHPSRFDATERADLAVRHLSMAIEHREAMILLVRHSANTSAFALLRPCYEALMRGMWAQFAASDADIHRAMVKGIAPSFDTVTKQLSKQRDFKPFAAVKKDVWSIFSDYAHGGPRQLARWGAPGSVEPTHSEEEIVSVMLLADVYGYHACITLHHIASSPAKPIQDVYTSQLQARLVDRVAKGPS